MTTPFWCLLAACLIPYFIAPIGGYFRVKQFGEMDNKNPRAQGAQLTGVGARAQAAQSNAWEALPVFASAVIVAHLAGADPGSSSTAALVFIAARIGHAGAYLADLDKARSGIFTLGLGCCVWLFVLAARA
jgi:uncharacterized MAPEG superfamily protein